MQILKTAFTNFRVLVSVMIMILRGMGTGRLFVLLMALAMVVMIIHLAGVVMETQETILRQIQ
ncbi:hypothetical protein CIFRMM088M_22555 [Citrobacter freundii]